MVAMAIVDRTQQYTGGAMSEPLTDAQLAAIAAADAARTPGTWQVGGYGSKYGDLQSEMTVRRMVKSPADAEFVAVASWAIPALLAEVARLQVELDERDRRRTNG